MRTDLDHLVAVYLTAVPQYQPILALIASAADSQPSHSPQLSKISTMRPLSELSEKIEK